MDLGIKNKWALVTGSNRGTGEMMARQLAAEGARVIVHSLAGGPSAEVAATIDGAVAVWGDVASEKGSNQVVDQVHEHTTRLDILVNNYGTATGGKWLSSSTDDWIDIYQKNTISVARLVRAFVPAMKETGNGGRIVNLGTFGSIRPSADMPHYYASKGALATMTVSLAKELAGTGITVNLVLPGVIKTAEVEASLLKRAKRENWKEQSWSAVEKRVASEIYPIPLGRLAEREEIADLVLYLCSERASYIHGQNIRIDGGAVDTI
jgi:3-oxoacyl-[acyl-carrier protein] reductase